MKFKIEIRKCLGSPLQGNIEGDITLAISLIVLFQPCDKIGIVPEGSLPKWLLTWGEGLVTPMASPKCVGIIFRIPKVNNHFGNDLEIVIPFIT